MCIWKGGLLKPFRYFFFPPILLLFLPPPHLGHQQIVGPFKVKYNKRSVEREDNHKNIEDSAGFFRETLPNIVKFKPQNRVKNASCAKPSQIKKD
mmetsp:Transcript_20130/g.27967  ORF Transcript_20130/g.27967 Transcript_20130/m.27967 type:complete len:95 (-) Transcript_20130:568-852(-)